jgi:hypothetical protein
VETVSALSADYRPAAGRDAGIRLCHQRFGYSPQRKVNHRSAGHAHAGTNIAPHTALVLSRPLVIHRHQHALACYDGVLDSTRYHCQSTGSKAHPTSTTACFSLLLYAELAILLTTCFRWLYSTYEIAARRCFSEWRTVWLESFTQSLVLRFPRWTAS